MDHSVIIVLLTYYGVIIDHGVIMVLSWCYHGVIMVLSWCYHGVIMVLSWCYHGVIMDHGVIIVLLWCYYFLCFVKTLCVVKAFFFIFIFEALKNKLTQNSLTGRE